MKRIVFIAMIILTIIGFATGLWYGKNNSTQPERKTALEHAIKHMDRTYHCPMHPQVTSDKPGNCPICGMDLVPLSSTVKRDESEILFYRHPMNPSVTSNKPQKDSMGMDFIPVYADETTQGSLVTIAPEIISNLGVRTAKVERSTFSQPIDTVGYISPNESLIGHVHLRTAGWVENLMIDTIGDRVEKGQLLFNLYSPALVNAQEEYVLALKANNERLASASRQKLLALGVSATQIDRLTTSNKVERTISVYAHHKGIVTDLMVREGMYVEPATETVSIVDLSNVWLQAEVFESQSGWVESGQSVEARVSSIHDRIWTGIVDYVYPSIDPVTRTLKVRLKFDNPDELLKPNMFAHVSIFTNSRENILVVPREAIIRDGSNERVMLTLGQGRFAQRIVKTGIESGELTEIMAGLEEGDEIVISAQFLLDSEASLKAGFQRIQAEMEVMEDSP